MSPIIHRTQFSTLFQAISHMPIKLSEVIKDSIKTNFQLKFRISTLDRAEYINNVNNAATVMMSRFSFSELNLIWTLFISELSFLDQLYQP